MSVINSSIGEPSITAIAFFFAFVAMTLAITYWAARKTKTTEEIQNKIVPYIPST